MTDKTTIGAAICAAMGDIKTISKDERNEHSAYDFASIDKFLEMANPICAKNGLFSTVEMKNVETFNSRKGTLWGKFQFEIALHHKDGDQMPPVNIVVMSPITGPQTSGAVQSYALKQFLRGQFLIPTGDKDDADHTREEEIKVELVSSDQIADITTLTHRAGVSREKICKRLGVSEIKDIPASGYAGLVKKLNITIEKNSKEAASKEESKPKIDDEIPY